MSREHGGLPPERETVIKMDREAIRVALERGEMVFEGRDLKDLDLTELPLEGTSFRGADVRGLRLCREAGEPQEARTNIRGTDWTDAVFADTGLTLFRDVDAERARFGFSESLQERRGRLAQQGTFGPEDSGAYYGFDGRAGMFRGTEWREIDFGGSLDADGNPVEGMEAMFAQADLSNATFIGVDLTGIDWSDRVKIENIIIQYPASLRGLTITKQQAESLARGIRISNELETEAWEKEKEEKGDVRALQEFFGVIVIAGKSA